MMGCERIANYGIPFFGTTTASLLTSSSPTEDIMRPWIANELLYVGLFGRRIPRAFVAIVGISFMRV